jgi:hypothetical protein
MKTVKFFLLVAIIAVVDSQSNENMDLVVLKAIKGILQDFFEPRDPKVDLYFSGQKSEKLAEKVLLEKPSEVSIRVIRLDAVVNKTQIDFPSILLFDSDELYVNMLNNIAWTSKNGVWHNCLIYVPKTEEYEVTEALEEYKIMSDHQNFINLINDSTVDLITSYKFLPGKCSSVQYKTINRFTTDTMKWQNTTFFPEQYENFNNCTLRVAYQPSMEKNLTQDIFSVLAQQLNFQIEEVQVSDVRAPEKSSDIIAFTAIQSIWMLEEFFEFSSSLFTDHMTFTVPAGEPYTQLEKMFLMFDTTTWICIGATLAATLLMIQLVSFMSIEVQNFVFGRNIRTPTLNLADIFLNGGQNRVPGRNFARFMLMLFVIWSLIIRTCYQSFLYANLQEDMRKPKIQSIDEFNEKNFTLVYEHAAREYISRRS